jgi:hypothetical protein
MEEGNNRTLTDDDIAAIVKGLEHRLEDRFYKDVGRGVWAVVWKGLLMAMIGLAAYGATKGIK